MNARHNFTKIFRIMGAEEKEKVEFAQLVNLHVSTFECLLASDCLTRIS
jgi:hypothetical protein